MRVGTPLLCLLTITPSVPEPACPYAAHPQKYPMTGKAYYLTTLGALQRHSARLYTSHWLALVPQGEPVPAIGESDASEMALPGTAQILALVEADEGGHLALEDDAEFQALPHPLAQRPISQVAQEALAAYGVAPGATTFDVAEMVARVHPLLRHRVF
jgi:hypothetical protein